MGPQPRWARTVSPALSVVDQTPDRYGNSQQAPACGSPPGGPRSDEYFKRPFLRNVALGVAAVASSLPLVTAVRLPLYSLDGLVHLSPSLPSFRTARSWRVATLVGPAFGLHVTARRTSRPASDRRYSLKWPLSLFVMPPARGGARHDSRFASEEVGQVRCIERESCSRACASACGTSGSSMNPYCTRTLNKSWGSRSIDTRSCGST
jgi:hypothetical protein